MVGELMTRRLFLLAASLGLGLALLLIPIWLVAARTPPLGAVSGVVVDAHGSLAGATVRQRATGNVTSSGSDGRFTLIGLVPDQPIELTAWLDSVMLRSLLPVSLEQDMSSAAIITELPANITLQCSMVFPYIFLCLLFLSAECFLSVPRGISVAGHDKPQGS